MPKPEGGPEPDKFKLVRVRSNGLLNGDRDDGPKSSLIQQSKVLEKMGFYEAARMVHKELVLYLKSILRHQDNIGSKRLSKSVERVFRY